MSRLSFTHNYVSMALGMAITATSLIPATSVARENSAPSQSPQQSNQRTTAPRGVAETAPASGGSVTSGGGRNEFGDPKTNRAGIPNQGRSGGQGASNSGGNEISMPDRKIMRELAQVHLGEVKMSGLATAISQDPAIVSYAEKMLEVHLTALDELRAIADQYGVILPGGVEKDQAALLNKLALQAGPDFDQLYLEMAGIQEHQQSHRRFQEASNRAQLPELKTYVANFLPTIERHLQLAQQMKANPSTALGAVQATVKAGQSTSVTASSGTSSGQASNNSAAKGNASVAGNPAGVKK